MSAKFRNTTALVAAFSLALPAVAPAQQMVDNCEAGSVGISADVASELNITLPEAQQAALDGQGGADTMVVTTEDGAREVCMTYTELETLGANQDAVMAAVDANASGNDKGLLGKAIDAITGGGDDTAADANANGEANANANANANAQANANDNSVLNGDAAAATDTGANGLAGTGDASASGTDTMAATGTDTGAAATTGTDTMAATGTDTGAAATTGTDTMAATGTDTGAAATTGTDTMAATGTDAGAAATTGTDTMAATGTDTTATANTGTANTNADAQATTSADANATAGTPSEAEMQQMAAAIEEQSAQEADPAAQAQAAESDAPVATAEAATQSDAAAASVEEVTITEDNARSSSEEFDQKLQTATAGTAAQTNATGSASASSDKGGMSDLEKALLVGLGAVVVGKALQGDSKAQVVSKSNDRVVVLEDGRYRVIRDDNELIERPGSQVRRETFNDGSTRTTVTRDNGVQIVTIRDPELRVLRRTRIDTDGTRTVLIDDTTDVQVVDVATLPEPVQTQEVDASASADALRAALSTKSVANRRFALYQVRNIERVRKLAPSIDLDAINFRTGSAVIDPQEAEELSKLGNLIHDYIDQNPGEIFLVEGHTDAVGNAAYNLALSDRRAESVALALTEYFDVPPENLVVQGYGESDLKVRTLGDERANRRAAVRRITPLITTASAN